MISRWPITNYNMLTVPPPPLSLTPVRVRPFLLQNQTPTCSSSSRLTLDKWISQQCAGYQFWQQHVASSHFAEIFHISQLKKIHVKCVCYTVE